ncbi:hypothetical protein SEA_FRANCOIS_11 [Gordonia phage Francois]|nr:hypothetical protein SEA_FRANCOIS_11 [Gordonia phage Francois]
MTQYRLAALEYRQVVTETVCPTCGHEKPGVVLETKRYRQGDVIDVVGDEEVRLLAAGALAPVLEVVDVDADAGDEPAGDGDKSPAEPGVVEPPAGDQSQTGTGAQTGDQSQAPTRPRKAGLQAEWVEYALATGAVKERDAAEKMTKAELQAAVGEEN